MTLVDRIKNNLLTRIGIVFAAGAGSFIAMGYPFFRFISYAGKTEKKRSDSNRKKWFQLKHTRINHPRHGYENEYEAGREWCERQVMQDWYVVSHDGLMLHASYYPAENAKRIVLLSHGYRGTRFGSIAHMARFLHETGSSLLFIDQRCCGESEGEYITFGAKEQYDIIAWLKKIHDNIGAGEKNGKRLPVYLYGQSMGASTVILASGHKLSEEVHGLIADCGFHSMKQQLRDIASGWFHLHWIELFLMRVDLFCHIFAGFRMKDTDTTESLKSGRLPILFFHGEQDTYVWPGNSVMNYELSRAEKELVLVPDARHLCSSYVDPELYKNKLTEFFNKYD